MKILISWSGEQSKRVAIAFHSWISDVLQAVSPWMSESDISAGTRWNLETAKELSETSFGILCLTAENLTAPWICFEAGALAKSLEQGRVCPYLLGIEPEDIPNGPLTQFQAKRANKDETFQLLKSINSTLDSEALPEASLLRAFNTWWPNLETALDQARRNINSPSKQRPMPEILNEVLNEVRSISRRLPPSAQQTARELEHKRQFAKHENICSVVFADNEITSRNITRQNSAWDDNQLTLSPDSPRGKLSARIDEANWHMQEDAVLRNAVAPQLIAKLVKDYESRQPVDNQQ